MAFGEEIVCARVGFQDEDLREELNHRLQNNPHIQLGHALGHNIHRRHGFHLEKVEIIVERMRALEREFCNSMNIDTDLEFDEDDSELAQLDLDEVIAAAPTVSATPAQQIVVSPPELIVASSCAAPNKAPTTSPTAAPVTVQQQ